MADQPQIDFYQLGSADLDASRLACRLALMAWERGNRITVLTVSDEAAEALDKLMWDFPAGRFLPHAREGSDGQDNAPVIITQKDCPDAGDVLINLCPQPVREPTKFNRLLEIVPHHDSDRKGARDKFRHYREQGIKPAYHEISR